MPDPPQDGEALTPVVITAGGEAPRKKKRNPRPRPRRKAADTLAPWVWRCVDCEARGLVYQSPAAQLTSNVRLQICQDHAAVNPRYPVVDVWLRMDQPGQIMFRENAVVISYTDFSEPQFEVIHVVNAADNLQPVYSTRETPRRQAGGPGSPFAGHHWKGRPL